MVAGLDPGIGRPFGVSDYKAKRGSSFRLSEGGNYTFYMPVHIRSPILALNPKP